MEIASLGFRTDLMVRRLGGSTIEDRGDHLVVRTPENPGFRWGNFLLLPAPLEPGDARRWEGAFVDAFPGATHRAFGVDGTSGEAGDDAEVLALGVVPEVATVMTAPPFGLREPPAPVAHCRELRSDEEWDQAVRLRLACHEGPVEEEYEVFVRRKLEEARGLVERGYGAWLGAFDEGRMVSGLGIVSDGSGLARYQSVETHPGYRRRGLARALLYVAGRHAHEKLRAQTLVVVADPAYHAVELYRSLGFRERERQAQLDLPD